jgi:spermidine/putrescine transport system ATP-binding protein
VPDNALDELIRATSLVKRYGDVAALDGVSLSVREGEFLALLGPSGCGKTTLLRTIAGFIEPTSGELFINGQNMIGVAPNRRPVNTVFQNYALFPHMTVTENIAFGPRRRKIPRAEVEALGEEALALVGMEGYGGRYPSELSGGQQQRVALARAVINRPKVLLLDEPLGALDLKLRKRMQLELKHLQVRLGIAFIFVTHDQEEALVMADRIAVLRDGRVMQVGPGEEIYRNPSSCFVASFIGDANLLAVSNEDGALRLAATGTILPYEAKGGAAQVLMVRPEDIAIGETKAADAVGVEAIVRECIFLGDAMRVHAMVGDREEIVLQSGSMAAAEALKPGDRVAVHWPRDKARLLDA